MTTPQTPGQAQQAIPTAPDRYQFDQNGYPTSMIYANDFQGAFDHRHRVKVQPHVHPNVDPTIVQVLLDQEQCVAAMMQAFFNVNNIQDNDAAKSITYCTLGHADAFSGEDVEAACRTVFHMFMQHCRYGYSGYPSQNRLRGDQSATQKSSIQSIDLTATCRQRLNETIKTMRGWKSVCEAIMYSDDKIANLVNAPATTWLDKRNQRDANKRRAVANKKKGQAKKQLEARPQNVALTHPIMGGVAMNNTHGYDSNGAVNASSAIHSAFGSGSLSNNGFQHDDEERQMLAMHSHLSKHKVASPFGNGYSSSTGPYQPMASPAVPNHFPPYYAAAPQNGYIPPKAATVSSPYSNTRNDRFLAAPSIPSMRGDGNLSHQGDTNVKIKNSEFNYYINASSKPLDPSLMKPFVPTTGTTGPYMFSGNSTTHNNHNVTEASNQGVDDSPPPPPHSHVTSYSKTSDKRDQTAAMEPLPPSHHLKRDRNGSYYDDEYTDGDKSDEAVEEDVVGEGDQGDGDDNGAAPGIEE